MSETRYPWAKAYTIAVEICNRLQPGCVRFEIAGSLRRHKPDVGDIEILYIPAMEPYPDQMLFETGMRNAADTIIRHLLAEGVLQKRLNAKGHETYGEKNKLMMHVDSGIPVDLFAATEENWFNYLVCRTGPADLNQRICLAAQRKGWKWNPYGPGFSNTAGEVRRMENEAAVFQFVDLPVLTPEERE